MKKLLLLFIFICSFLVPINCYAIELIDTYSKSVIIYDLDDDQVLLSRNENEIRSVASLTKIMTTICAIKMIEDDPNINFDDTIVVTNDMLEGLDSSLAVAGIKPGDVVTYTDLLYSIILPSGADATYIIGNKLSGNLSLYVEKMNLLAKEIGCTNTNFYNVHGLDNENHFSTANDILKILKYSMENDLFKKIYTTKTYTLTNGLQVNSTVRNYNKKIGLDTSRILGSKTGYTGNAGTCFSSYFISNNHHFLTVTLGSEYKYNDALHVRDNLNIIDFIDNNYNNQVILKKNSFIKRINVHYSNKKYLNISNTTDIVKYLPNDYDKKLFTYKYIGNTDIYPSTKGTIGNINYYYNNIEIYSEKVIVKDIKFSLLSFINENIVYLSLIVVIGIFLIFIITKKKLLKQ